MIFSTVGFQNFAVSSGALLQVIHTGLDSKALALRGTIKEIRHIRLRDVQMPATKTQAPPTWRDHVLAYVVTVVPGAALIGYVTHMREWSLLVPLVFVWLFMGLVVTVRYWRARVPGGLARYHED
jgi:hypothetical protein